MDHLPTEARNPASTRLDELTSVEIVELMASEDANVPKAVAEQKVAIAQAIDAIALRLAAGGRLIYCGAGTSGRLGVLDATECPPTFHSPANQVIGLIAGGYEALTKAVEGAEDRPELGEGDLKSIAFTANDVLVGIASSGRTPYVLGAVRHAKSLGAFTIALVCNPGSELEPEVDLAIVPVVGPEVLSGSTRLKAGTATKLVLNMLTTGAMVRLGKTFGNLMVDLKATNVKLKARANRIVRTITGLDAADADELLTKANGELKTALVVQVAGVSVEDARAKLRETGGRVGELLRRVRSESSGGAIARERRSDLVLGFDGGGTNTIALLAKRETGELLGRGQAGPSNIQSVGVEAALKALEDSANRAFQAAGIPGATVAAATLGLAGVDRREGLDVINAWSARIGLAEKVSVANDATLLLAAGTPEGWGLAVIAGTGSIAFVRSQTGEVGRCGGWGHTLGDEGSAYQIVREALRAACRSHDKCAPPTVLVERFVKRMNLNGPPDLIPAVYRGPWDRAAIAGLAPLVLEAAAEGDILAEMIVRKEAHELALTAAGAVKNNELPLKGIPVALAGGLLLKSESYKNHFLNSLSDAGITAGVVTSVPEPALGAVVLAQRLLSPR